MSLEIPPLHIHLLIIQALQLQKGYSLLEMGCGVGYLLALAAYITESSDVSGIDVGQQLPRLLSSTAGDVGRSHGDQFC